MSMTSTRRFALLSTALLALATVTGGEALQIARAEGPIRITEAFARAGLAGGNAAAFMRIENRGEAPDRLLAAISDVASRVELHETLIEGGTMQMRPVAAIEVPAGGAAVLQPGGLHVMLIGLRRKLEAGEPLELRLRFARAGEMTLSVPVRAAGALSHGQALKHERGHEQPQHGQKPH
jgi:copper(I)-binding protein